MKFRRKSAVEPADVTEEDVAVAADEVPARGPFDADDVAGDGLERVDLGSLLITPQPEREIRLQVDEATQTVESVLIAGPDGALELRAFAAPRHGDLWAQARPQIAAETSQQGGTATEREGSYGIELLCQRPVTRADGKGGMQPTRVVGINGSRWFLRATFLGHPAREPDNATDWDDTLASVVVQRGQHAMPVGDPLPLTLPPDARRSS